MVLIDNLYSQVSKIFLKIIIQIKLASYKLINF